MMDFTINNNHDDTKVSIKPNLINYFVSVESFVEVKNVDGTSIPVSCPVRNVGYEPGDFNSVIIALEEVKAAIETAKGIFVGDATIRITLKRRNGSVIADISKDDFDDFKKIINLFCTK